MKTGKYGPHTIWLAGLACLWLSVQTHCAAAEPFLLAQVAGYSYHVLFSGIFYEPDQAPEGTRRPYTLDVIVGGEKKWVFVVDKAVSLGRTATELRILKSVFPPQLSFRGEKRALDYLQDPNIAGRPLTVEGHLYSKERRLRILRVEPITDGEEPAE